jgi:hypothetical protein
MKSSEILAGFFQNLKDNDNITEQSGEVVRFNYDNDRLRVKATLDTGYGLEDVLMGGYPGDVVFEDVDGSAATIFCGRDCTIYGTDVEDANILIARVYGWIKEIYADEEEEFIANVSKRLSPVVRDTTEKPQWTTTLAYGDLGDEANHTSRDAVIELDPDCTPAEADDEEDDLIVRVLDGAYELFNFVLFDTGKRIADLTEEDVAKLLDEALPYGLGN